MPNQKREIEATGQDVESAIEAGLAELGVGRDNVIIEVVDEGSKGLLGLGMREAVVRLTAMVAPPPTTPPEMVTKPLSPSSETAVSPPQPPPEEAEEREVEQQIALEVVQTLLEKMQIESTITCTVSEPDEITGQRVNLVQVSGNDLGVLIGPRGETLNALQFVCRLIAGHKLRRRANLVVDVEGYRERREQALFRMAKRMARKVSNRGRPAKLEPMPPHERRIIHIALRNSDEVYTQSVGEGSRRQVRIIPKHD